jgi:hypothetical protein
MPVILALFAHFKEPNETYGCFSVTPVLVRLSVEHTG